MAGGRAETYDQRADILGGILVRNRVVAALRIVVPALGVAVFLLLAAQIYLAGLARQYGVSGIRIDRGVVVVEAPQYSGTGSDGSRYLVSAREARTPLDRSDMIELTDATLELLQSGGITYFARSAAATMDTGSEKVTAPGVVAVTGSDGLEGTLTDVEVDSPAEVVVSNGAVDLLLPDGTTIVADGMVHEGKARLWTFTRATVVVPDLPADGR
jgi:lipopolysaccharide export system protein LptC